MKHWIKRFAVLLCIGSCVLGINSCQKKKATPSSSNDFEALTGKDLPVWDYVKTKEDVEHLTLFKHMFDLKKGLLGAAEPILRIPKVVHFIWIGPNQFPR